jgi:hypothetical protein
VAKAICARKLDAGVNIKSAGKPDALQTLRVLGYEFFPI